MTKPRFNPGDRVKFHEYANNTGTFVEGIVVEWPTHGDMVSRKLPATKHRLPNPFRVLNVPVRVEGVDGKALIVIVPKSHCVPAGTVDNVTL